jgi:hypothetical protein
MTSRTVRVSQLIEVTVDESKFTPEFMSEFRRETMYSFTLIEDHIAHLAQLYARSLVHDNRDYIEGYGIARDMGIKFKQICQDEELL